MRIIERTTTKKSMRKNRDNRDIYTTSYNKFCCSCAYGVRANQLFDSMGIKNVNVIILRNLSPAFCRRSGQVCLAKRA